MTLQSALLRARALETLSPRARARHRLKRWAMGAMSAATALALVVAPAGMWLNASVDLWRHTRDKLDRQLIDEAKRAKERRAALPSAATEGAPVPVSARVER